MTSGTPELTPAGKQPLLTSIFQCSTEFLEELKFYFEQNPPTIPISNIPGFQQFTFQNAPTILTSEGTASATYANLATTGPLLSNLPDGQYAILFGFQLDAAGTGAGPGSMSFQWNSNTAVDDDSCIAPGLAYGTSMRVVTKTLNVGSNSITCNYRSSSGTVKFMRRWLTVIKYANL